MKPEDFLRHKTSKKHVHLHMPIGLYEKALSISKEKELTVTSLINSSLAYFIQLLERGKS